MLHAVFLSIAAMPRAPKIPEFLVVEMASLPQYSSPATVTQARPAQRAAVSAVSTPKAAQPQPVEKKPEMAEPVKHAPTPAPSVQSSAPVTAQAVSTGQSVAATAVKGSAAVSGKIGPAAPSGPVEGAFGTSDGPAFVHSIQPVYPRIARKLGKEGTVLLRITLDEKGALVSVVVVEKAGHGFDEAAVNAVKASRFKAAKQRGVPVACRALLPIRFKLED